MIEEMVVQNGFEFHCGPHYLIRGYYATFYHPGERECETCGEHDSDWSLSGHGDTLVEAIKQARAIALGQPYVKTTPADFRKDN